MTPDTWKGYKNAEGGDDGDAADDEDREDDGLTGDWDGDDDVEEEDGEEGWMMRKKVHLVTVKKWLEECKYCK